MKAPRPAREINVGDGIHLHLLRQETSPLIFDTIDQNRHELRKWLPFVDNTWKEEDTSSFVRSVVQIPFPKREIVYEIWHEKEFAGLIALKETDYWNHKTEIGYWLDPGQQGKGIMTRCCRALISHAFSKLGMNRVQIKVGIGNARSGMIPERLGFRFEGIERCGEKFHDHYSDIEVYSLLKKEWKNQKPKRKER